MANGKGALACYYCQHESAGECKFHGVSLPTDSKHGNMICGNFEPDKRYWRDNTGHSPPARRFAWFGRDLKPGVLYGFHYNAPESIEEIAVLRKPNYETGGWEP